MKLRTRLLRAVSNDCGPAGKATLRGIARAHGQEDGFAETFASMLADGAIVMFSDKRHAVYGPPRGRRPR